VFETRYLPASPLYVLLHSWPARLQDRRFLFDVAVNIAIYLPLGASAYMAMRRFTSRILVILAPVVLGTLLSATIEMAQLFTPRRVCSGVDLVCNILGSALGVLAGIAFTRISDTPVHGLGLRFRDRRAIVLLFCWVSFLLFPFYPDLWLSGWRAKLSAFGHPLAMSPILVNAAEWFAAGRLLFAAGARPTFRWLFVSLLLMLVQFGIVNHSPKATDFAAVSLAAILFRFFGLGPRADLLAGISLLIALALGGLSPYHPVDSAQAISWIPFAGLLESEQQNAIPVLFRKLFRYGASIWLLHRAGLSAMRAAAIVILVLAGIEVLQIWLPGHVAETTDPLLALLLCLGLRALGRVQVYPKESG